MARRARLHLVHVQRHARRARRPGPQCFPRVAPASGSPLPPPAGSGPALGRHRGRIGTRHWDLPPGGLPLPGAAGNSGREIRRGAASALVAWAASLQLGRNRKRKDLFITLLKQLLTLYSWCIVWIAVISSRLESHSPSVFILVLNK